MVLPLCRGRKHQLQSTFALLLWEKKLALGSKMNLGKQSRGCLLATRRGLGPKDWHPLPLPAWWSFSGEDARVCMICLWSAGNTDQQRWMKMFFFSYHILHNCENFSCLRLAPKANLEKKININNKIQKFRSDQKEVCSEILVFGKLWSVLTKLGFFSNVFGGNSLRFQNRSLISI